MYVCMLIINFIFILVGCDVLKAVTNTIARSKSMS